MDYKTRKSLDLGLGEEYLSLGLAKTTSGFVCSENPNSLSTSIGLSIPHASVLAGWRVLQHKTQKPRVDVIWLEKATTSLVNGNNQREIDETTQG